ncbi:nucleoside-diphosphate sugar epimerase/dehydratase [Desulfovibrionales bacterium]
MHSRSFFALLRNKNFYLVVIGEAGLFACALVMSYALRFEFDIPEQYFWQILHLLPVAMLTKMIFFAAFGLYRGMWRYTGLADLWRIARATLLAEVALIVYAAFFRHFQGYPRSVFILDPLLTFVLACGARVLIRSGYEFMARPRTLLMTWWPQTTCPLPEARLRAFILGADDDAARMAKEIQGSTLSGITLVGFVDDDPVRIGRKIHDLPVYGPIQTLPELACTLRAQEVLVSTTLASQAQLRSVLEACEAGQVRIKKLPPLADIASGKISVKALRDVRYEDLLGRAEIKLDVQGIEGYLKGRTVLITGAGGSIGSELCRQILRFEPKKIVLYDASESNLYAMEMELLHERGFGAYVSVLGQTQDQALLESVLTLHQPQVLFHAAAYKHVPMLEHNPWQAVTNNIMGSRTVMAAAVRYGVERFVLVSTDKAVRPTNVMGASKRVTELLMREFLGQGTIFMAVRFGNVLGSSGSVVPLFRRQIAQGGPVTVTHPDVTRYFMTIPEAAQLIIQAGVLGQGGEVFILKMGRPVRIADLARDLIVLSGKSVEEIPIHFTGLRAGEKLYEELITVGEGIVETGHDEIMVLHPDTVPAQGDAGLDLSALCAAAACFDGKAVVRHLSALVPEFTPDSRA